jgi:16S rRNA (uracil1498-N3)-methyltransferase
MLRRFFCSNLSNSTSLMLEGREAHHAYSVLRFRAGQEVELFDGQGNQASATITEINKRLMTVERGDVINKQPFPLTIHLAQAVPHKKKIDDIVEKSEELGVSKVLLMKSQFTVFDFKKDSFDKLVDRLKSLGLEGAKQSRNNFLMDVEGWVTSSKVCERFNHYSRVFLMKPGSEFKPDPFEGVASENASILILIGPEGGFSEAEEQVFEKAGAHPVPMGDILLRCDTAAVAAVSLLKFAYERKYNGN